MKRCVTLGALIILTCDRQFTIELSISGLETMLPKDMRIRTLFVFFLFDFTGVGLRKRNVLHWFLLAVNIVQRCSYLYLTIKNTSFSLYSISLLLIDLNLLLLFFTSLNKLQSVRELFFLIQKLSGKEYILLRIVDAGTFILFFALVSFEIVINGLDQCGNFNKLWHLEGNSTLVVVVQRTLCLNFIISIHDIDSFSALYILIFLVLFFVKVRHLKSISTSRPSCWKSKILTLSSQVAQLGQKLDDSTSFILFCRAVHQFFLILLVFLMAMLFYHKSLTFGKDIETFLLLKFLADLLLTALLFLSISLMQEQVTKKSEDLSRQIVYSAFDRGKILENLVLANILTSDFNHKVTVWKLVEVSRTIILTLASVYIAFPVLCWQVDNGALGFNFSAVKSQQF